MFLLAFIVLLIIAGIYTYKNVKINQKIKSLMNENTLLNKEFGSVLKKLDKMCFNL